MASSPFWGGLRNAAKLPAPSIRYGPTRLADDLIEKALRSTRYTHFDSHK